MLKIGLVGLGSIFQKAYLPCLKQFSTIEWHLFTRNKETLSQIADGMVNSHIYDSVQELAKVPLDGVMIHVATQAHVELAKLFLEQGIPVYMDKPLSEDYEQTLALYQLAQARGVFLIAGFNCRFAPKVQQLKEQSDKRRILVEKNDVNSPGELQFKLFDLFLHPLDTALYLLDSQLEAATFSYHLEEGLLSQVSVTLRAGNTSAVAAMNLQSGSRREIMEVQTPQATYQLKNLEDMRIFTADKEVQDGFGAWENTLYKRGFETIIHQFLESLETKVNPVDPKSSLLSHWLCHQILHSRSSRGELDVYLPEKVTTQTTESTG